MICITGIHESKHVAVAPGSCNRIIGMAKDKSRMEMVVEGDETKSSHKAASNETEKSEGLSGMPEIENH